MNPVIMTNAEYHAHPAVSKSDLDLIARSPLHYKAAKESPKEQTPAMLLGSLVHKLVLEPDTFGDEYYALPQIDRRTKEGKTIYQECMKQAEGKTLIDDALLQQAAEIAAAVRSNPIAAKLLQGGEAETSHFWTEDGIECKCRPDYLRADKHFCIDLKTTENASPDEFVKTAYKYRYHVQAAWYLRGLKACGIDVANFIFIAVEKQPPYAVCVYAADELMINLGTTEALENLETYKGCLTTGNWYGYEKEPLVHSLSLPEWIIKKNF